MEVTFKPKMGRPKCTEPLDKIESTPVTDEMKKKISALKYQGLMLNDMTREFWAEIIKRAESGQIEGIKKSAS